MTRARAVLVLSLLALARVAQAQGGGGGPPRVQVSDSIARARADSVLKDSLQVVLAPPDSMMRALLARRGYAVTRYQGDSVRFTAAERGFFLKGAPAIVVRDSTRIRGDSVEYRDDPARVAVWGSPSVMDDPGRGEPLRAFEPMRYFLEERRAVAGGVCTIATDGPAWLVCAERGAFVSSDGRPVIYGSGGTISTDHDPLPHYHFRIGSIKLISRNLMVARPAVLYVGEVPVLWIPWLFQDMRPGRRSGILTPRFGVSDVVRNSPTYRRTVENLGFYLALSDYYDAQFSLDWRSGARPTPGDAGWLRLNGEFRYRWLDRFMTGGLTVSRMKTTDDQTNLLLSWSHNQEFSQRTKLISSLAYAANTTLQRQTLLNPVAVTANIRSTVNYSTQLGPFATSIGGTRQQYPGRDQVDQDFPALNITTSPIELAPWLTWTPGLSANVSQSFKIDLPSEFAHRYVTGPGGALDSVRIDRNTRTSTLSFNTPFKVGDFNITARLNMADRFNDFPEAKVVINPVDTSDKRVTVFRRTYLTTIDWDVGMALPQLLSSTWRLTPGITLRNVDPGGYWVRSERSGADFVSQSKRVSYGLSVSPTFFGLTGFGLGPYSRFRHSVSPSLTYSYSPAAQVSDEYLAAMGRTRAGYLGALAQNRLSLGLNQVFEAAVRGERDSASSVASPKVKLLSLQFSALEYDFERARATGGSGFASDRFSYTASSDLLPGLNVTVGYSLFEGSVLSDTAKFDPYRESISATLSFGSRAGGVGALGRLWGWVTGEPMVTRRDTAQTPLTPVTPVQPAPGAFEGLAGAGSNRVRPALTEVPRGQGFQATLTLSSTTPRPISGDNVLIYDPRARCEPLLVSSPQQYEICLRQQGSAGIDPSFTETTGGGTIFAMPPSTSIQASVSFDLTPNWAASWQTSYDAERSEFASQIVSLQRNLHDWRAVFGFTQAPNGNFAFNFLLSLKPAPEIQLPYNQQSYRSTGATGQ